MKHRSPSKVLFFSRGRGYGHAIPDMAIADELVRQHPHIETRFASYATGAEVFRQRKREVIDLGLPEANPFFDTLQAAYRAVRAESPDVIVAHEEFAALPAGKLLGARTLYMGAWLPLPGTIPYEALAAADGIIVLGEPGVFPVPDNTRAQPLYTGPILRPMRYTAKDREPLRTELDWPKDCFCVVVLPGGFNGEDKAPMADLLIAAFARLPFPRKRLCWISSQDQGTLAAKFAHAPDMEAMPFTDPIERLLSAADLIVTKGTRGATLDAAAVGVPSLSLSPGLNPIDDILVPRIRSNTALTAAATDAESLAAVMVRAADRSNYVPMPSHQPLQAVRLAAEHIAAATGEGRPSTRE